MVVAHAEDHRTHLGRKRLRFSVRARVRVRVRHVLTLSLASTHVGGDAREHLLLLEAVHLVRAWARVRARIRVRS